MVQVLHRLELYRQLGGEEVGVPGYPSSCPPSDCAPGSHCSHGLCFCDAGQWIKYRPISCFHPDDQDVPLESLEVDTPANATAADLSAAAYDASYVDHEGKASTMPTSGHVQSGAAPWATALHLLRGMRRGAFWTAAA